MDVEPRILVVDDEENLLRSVAKTLWREGFMVETANGNQPAFNLVQAAARTGEPFNLIILDLNMPNFAGQEAKYAGLELLKRLRASYPAIPVIVNSAWNEVTTAKMCLDQGAADYFVKGRTEEMLQKIRMVLNLPEE